MTRALLDTDIYSEVLKAVDRRVLDRATAYLEEYGRYTISAITVMEIVKGLHRRGQTERTTTFLDRLRSAEVPAFDRDAADLAGRIAADLERAGRPIGRADPMIAAIALRDDLVLVTGNERHYGHVRAVGYDLKLDNWRA